MDIVLIDMLSAAAFLLPSGPGGFDRMIIYICGIIALVVGVILYSAATGNWLWLNILSPRRGKAWQALAEDREERRMADDSLHMDHDFGDDPDDESGSGQKASVPERRRPTWEALGWDPASDSYDSSVTQP